MLVLPPPSPSSHYIHYTRSKLNRHSKTYMMSVSEQHRSLDLATELNSLMANSESRRATLTPLCILAYVFDRSQGIPASILRPSSTGDARNREQTMESLSDKGLLSAHRAEDGQLYLGFGTVSRTDAHTTFSSGSILQDDIVEWTVESGCHNDMFHCAVTMVGNAGSLPGNRGDFPTFKNILRLMDGFERLPDKHHGLQADVIVAFGTMLLTRAA